MHSKSVATFLLISGRYIRVVLTGGEENVSGGNFWYNVQKRNERNVNSRSND